MYKNAIIYTAFAAGAATLFYFLKRNKARIVQQPPQPVQQSRHLTNVFAKAKQSAS